MTLELSVDGMTCQGCEEIVEHAIELADAVEDVEADRYDKVARVEGDPNVEDVIEKVRLAGYDAESPS